LAKNVHWVFQLFEKDKEGKPVYFQDILHSVKRFSSNRINKAENSEGALGQKESKKIIGMDQFRTRKWMAWQHQVALNIMVACFILKEKLLCFDDLPWLSAYNIKEWIGYKLSKALTDEQMIDRIFIRHLQRQKDINRYYRIN